MSTTDPHGNWDTATEREVRHLLGRLDGLLGLAIYRGEASTQEWKDEARGLLIEIRWVLKRNALARRRRDGDHSGSFGAQP